MNQQVPPSQQPAAYGGSNPSALATLGRSSRHASRGNSRSRAAPADVEDQIQRRVDAALKQN